MKDVIYSINGPVVTVKDTSTFGMAEMVYVGNAGLIGEVISVSWKKGICHMTAELHRDRDFS